MILEVSVGFYWRSMDLGACWGFPVYVVGTVVLGVLFILLVDLCLLVFNSIGLLGFTGTSDFSPP